MKLVVGLGNPGKEYQNTRHNIGFEIVDNFKTKCQNSNVKCPFDSAQGRQNFRIEKKFDAEILKFKVDKEDIILAKPQTFMNNSGEAVRKITKFYKIKPANIIVICDDINLNSGQIRIRQGGSDGGHNGLKSIIGVIGENFWRVRVGIGYNKCQNPNVKCQNKPAEKYVLEKFSADEQKIIKKTIDKTAEFILESISNGLKEKTVNSSK